MFFDHANQVNSILQQQAQLILNQQKLDEVKKLAKATKAAIKQNKAALGGSMGSSPGKGSGYGTIGDLRYRNWFFKFRAVSITQPVVTVEIAKNLTLFGWAGRASLSYSSICFSYMQRWIQLYYYVFDRKVLVFVFLYKSCTKDLARLLGSHLDQRTHPIQTGHRASRARTTKTSNLWKCLRMTHHNSLGWQFSFDS